MLKIENLNKTFNKGTNNEFILFDDFKIEFEKNKCTAILGSNGSGKSTLMNLISGALESDGGNIYIEGEEISKLKEEERSKCMARVHQDPSLGVSPSLTIMENLALAEKKGEKFSLRRLIRKDRKEHYKELVSTLGLGLEDKLDTQVKFLSGGQRQSLSLLMATMKKPKLLLLDEHTAALDPKTSQLVLDKTRDLLEEYLITTVMISHNMKDAIEFSDRVIMLDGGKIILDKATTDITEEELNQIYIEKDIQIEVA